ISPSFWQPGGVGQDATARNGSRRSHGDGRARATHPGREVEGARLHLTGRYFMFEHDKNLDTLVQAGKQRLYPRITNPNWLVLRRRRMIFRAWLQRLSLQGPRVLDVGGRIQPYRELIAVPCEYWAIDLWPTLLVSAVANAA